MIKPLYHFSVDFASVLGKILMNFNRNKGLLRSIRPTIDGPDDDGVVLIGEIPQHPAPADNEIEPQKTKR